MAKIIMRQGEKGDNSRFLLFPSFHYFSPQDVSCITLYLICQYWALPIEQQIKIGCQNYGQMGIQVSARVDNIVGKGEIAHYEQFLLFPQYFQMSMCQNEYLWSKGLMFLSLSQATNLDSFKLKEFAVDNFELSENGR